MIILDTIHFRNFALFKHRYKPNLDYR